jgi:hypothetical protein
MAYHPAEASVGAVIITLFSCSDLPVADLTSSDPYVVFKLNKVTAGGGGGRRAPGVGARGLGRGGGDRGRTRVAASFGCPGACTGWHGGSDCKNEA